MISTLVIPNWHPACLNTFATRHWSIRVRIKAADALMVATYSRQQEIPKATGKRRVTLLLTLGKGQRAGDVDSFWKSLLDALVHAQLLTDDNRQGVELAPVQFERGSEKKTTITLEDIECCDS